MHKRQDTVIITSNKSDQCTDHNYMDMVMHDHVDTSPHTKLKSCQNMFATSMNIYLHYNLCFVTTDVAGTQVVLTLSHSDTNRSLLNTGRCMQSILNDIFPTLHKYIYQMLVFLTLYFILF